MRFLCIGYDFFKTKYQITASFYIHTESSINILVPRKLRIKDLSHKINPTNLKDYVVSWLTKFKLDKDFSYPTLDNFWIDSFI